MPAATAGSIKRYYGHKLQWLEGLLRAIEDEDKVMEDHYKVFAADEVQVIIRDWICSVRDVTDVIVPQMSRCLVEHPGVDPFEVTADALSMLQRVEAGKELMTKIMATIREWGHPCPLEAECETVHRAALARLSEVRETWPVYDPEIAAVSRNNFQRARARNAEDVFDELYAQGSR